MDINTLRSVLTALALGCFLAIAFWAYSKGARKGFDEAARLPFSDDDDLPAQRESAEHRG
jgi:cytochrome c oxidase cbb3-type subunit 4